MWGSFLVFVSDLYGETMKVMGKIYYFLSGDDLDAVFIWKVEINISVNIPVMPSVTVYQVKIHIML